MADNSEVYSIKFDPEQFVAGVNEALASTKKLDSATDSISTSMRELSNNVNKVNFNKPITEVSALKKSLESFAREGNKIDLSKFNGSIDSVLQDAPAIKAFLESMKKQLESLGDTQAGDKLRKEILKVEQSLKVLDGSSKTLSSDLAVLFDNLGESLRSVKFSNQLREEFDRALAGGTDDIETLKTVIKSLEKELGSMQVGSEGFIELSKTAEDAKAQLENLEGVDKAFVPLRKAIRANRLEMQKLEEQGLENTEQYKKLRIETAAMTDQFGDQTEAIRVLSSDTYALDATIDGVTQLTAAFQLYQGVTSLVGVESEELQETMVRLQALLNISNGLQQLQNFLRGQSAARLALETTWTSALAVSTRLLGVAQVGASAAARGLAAALAATGIGAIVVAVGLLVSALIDWADSSDDAKEATDRLNKSLETQQEILDLDISAIERANKKRLSLLKSRGASEKEIAEAELKGDKDLLERRETDYANAYKLYTDAKKKAAGRGNKEELDNIESLRKNLVKSYDNLEGERADIENKQRDNQTEANKKLRESQKKANDELLKLNESFNKKLSDIKLKATDVKQSQNPQSEANIRKRFEEEYKIEEAENNKAFAKLGKAKLDTINKASKQLSDLQADVEVQGFKEAQAQAQADILLLIKGQQLEITNERIKNIENDYDRVNAEIEQQEKSRTEEANKRFEDSNKQIEENLKKGLISPATAQAATADTIKILDDSLTLIAEETTRTRLENQKNLLQELLDQADQFATLQANQLDRQTADQVLAQSELLASGELSYSQYQRNINKIQKEAQTERLNQQITDGQEQLKVLEKQLALETDTIAQNALKSQIASVNAAIAGAKTAINEAGNKLEGVDSILGKIFGIDDEGELNTLKQGINNAIKSTIDLIKKASAAEVQAADKAVESQRRRVDEATKLAEEGNAEYLKQEEDRLREVELKREQSARKQLQIDAALQGSQILVAVAGASADAFKKGSGPAGVAVGIASIIAAIASGAALVRSLQNAQPRFFEGTDYVSRGNNPVGRDTIPAFLNEGEAVISTDINKRYGTTIKAIRRGLVPEDALNGFVNNYKHGNISSTIAGVKPVDTSHFKEMNQRLQRLEGVMNLTTEAIKGLGVNVKMDSDGFAASINTHLSKRNKILNS